MNTYQTHARKEDPQESHQAAASVKLENLGPVRDSIMKVLKTYKAGLRDEDISSYYRLRMYPPCSPSGLRSRRSELVRMGLVEKCGVGKTTSGRNCAIWRVK